MNGTSARFATHLQRSGTPARFSLDAFDDAELNTIHAALAQNTRKGYESDFREWSWWCEAHGITPLPIDPVKFAKYIHQLSTHGAATGTIARRFAALRYAEQTAGLPSALDDPRVQNMWNGIRRTHGRPPDQSLPIMPPLLWEILDATPTTNADGTPSIAGLRDHVLLLVGFTGALRRSELANIDVEHLQRHEHGIVLHIPTSKMNQTGEHDELVALPTSPEPGRCPVGAIDAWTHATNINAGPLLRGLTKYGKPRSTRIGESSINTIVQAAIARTGTDPTPYSAHGLRAGFITYADQLGVPARDIARHTRHKSLASLDGYVRVNELWTQNAAVALRSEGRS
jgi:integrase